jgi:hypothetical protein
MRMRGAGFASRSSDKLGRGPAENNRLAARLASLVCPTYIGPAVTPLAEPRKRVRRQGLALRVTRR